MDRVLGVGERGCWVQGFFNESKVERLKSGVFPGRDDNLDMGGRVHLTSYTLQANPFTLVEVND